MAEPRPQVAEILDEVMVYRAYVKFCELRGERPLPKTNPHFWAGYAAGIGAAIEHFCLGIRAGDGADG